MTKVIKANFSDWATQHTFTTGRIISSRSGVKVMMFGKTHDFFPSDADVKAIDYVTNCVKHIFSVMAPPSVLNKVDTDKDIEVTKAPGRGMYKFHIWMDK